METMVAYTEGGAAGSLGEKGTTTGSSGAPGSGGHLLLLQQHGSEDHQGYDDKQSLTGSQLSALMSKGSKNTENSD